MKGKVVGGGGADTLLGAVVLLWGAKVIWEEDTEDV